jgi:NDP-sugar pyrophosphorylase family protein
VERSVVGDGVVLGANVLVRNSVIMAGAVVDDRAEVIDSIVGPGAHVGADAIVCNTSVIGSGATVDQGETVDAAKRPVPA